MLHLKNDGLCHNKTIESCSSSVPNEAFRGPEAQLFEGPHLFNKNKCRMVSPEYSCWSHEIRHCALTNAKCRYAMRKWKRLSFHKLRNAKSSQFSHLVRHSNYNSTLRAFFVSKFMCQFVKSFVSVVVRSQYSSVTYDLNFVGDCETLTLASLSITATLIW